MYFLKQLFEECEACLKRLLEMKEVEDSIRAAARQEWQKFRNKHAEYKARSKAMQSKIAQKLFQSKDTNVFSKEMCDTAEESKLNEPTSAPSKEGGTDEEITLKVTEPAPTENKTAISAAQEAQKYFSAATSNNMIILIGTSLAVVVLSLIVAFYYN